MSSRRSLRSATDSRSKIPIPSTLPANGAISGRRVKRVKREHEDAGYAEVRSYRSGASILVSELRGEWEKLLLPVRGTVNAEGSGESAALAADAEVPEVPPLYLGACRGSVQAQQLLTRELATLITEEDWQELWVLLGQISMCIEQMARPDAVRPWWMRQAVVAGASGVAEQVDLVAREVPGAVDAPLDVAAAVEPAVKVESSDSFVNEDSSRMAWLGDWVVYAQLYDAQREISNGPPFWATTYATGWKAEGSTFKLLPDGSGELVTEKFGDGGFSVTALNGTVRYANGSFEWHASEEFRSEWAKWRDVWMPLEIDWLESDPPDRYVNGPTPERPAQVLTPGLRLRARLPCIPAFLDTQLGECGIYRDEDGQAPFEKDGTVYSSFREYVEKGCPWQAELYLCRPSDYTAAAAANEDLMEGFLLGG